MILWHATPKKNLESIMFQGIKPCLGEIYFTDNPAWAATFVAMRGIKEIVALPVELDIKDLKASYDHNSELFKCNCYVYHDNIPAEKIDWGNARKWDLSNLYNN